MYDWKYGWNENERKWGDFLDTDSIIWHIGGISRDKEEQFKEELVKLLSAV